MYQIKVDSCKLSIPLEKCNSISQELSDFFITQKINADTGELHQSNTQEKKRIPYQKNTDFGTYYKIWIEPQISAFGITEDFISILVNSKHLGKDYFKGITKQTIKYIYSNIMELDLFKCSFEDFINSRYQDIDIAFDFKCNIEHFEILKENITRSTLFPEMWATTSTEKNSGIWAPKTPSNIKPRNFATPSKPYVKFYSKEIDFQTKSYDFAKHFGLMAESSDIVRFEATIKNSHHKKLLKIDKLKTFKELLNSDLHAIIKDIIKRYFEKRKFVKSKEDTPMDKVLIDLIDLAISKGADKETIFKVFDREDVSRKSNYNLVQKYHTLYAEDKINHERLNANELSKNVFDFLGIDTQIKLDI